MADSVAHSRYGAQLVVSFGYIPYYDTDPSVSFYETARNS